jgi:hypothetical protein
MSIKIIKKGAIKQTKTGPTIGNLSADPDNDVKKVVEVLEVYDEAPLKKEQPIVCSYCGHAYLRPCNGENDQCGNKIWLLQKQKDKPDVVSDTEGAVGV